MCLWELTKRDSACELVLAIFSLLLAISLILWAAFRVLCLGQRSIKLHSNPAHILYSYPEALVNYGVFYIPFRARWYFFGFLLLFISLFEASFIGLSQDSALSQAIAFVVVESAKLTLVAAIKPYMDDRTNALNITIATIGVINAIMLTLFTRELGLPVLLPTRSWRLRHIVNEIIGSWNRHHGYCILLHQCSFPLRADGASHL